MNIKKLSLSASINCYSIWERELDHRCVACIRIRRFNANKLYAL